MSEPIAENSTERGDKAIGLLREKVRELEERCKRYDNIIEMSPICTKIIDLDRKLHFMSCAGHQALKIPDITEFYDQLYPPVGFDDDLSKLYDEHFPLALKGQATLFECPIPDMNGHREWYITHLIPMYDESGEIEFVLASSANITDRQQAEGALRESEEQFRTLVEQATSAIEIYEPDGKMLLVNDAWEELWNLAKEDVADFNILADPQCETTGLTSAFREAQQGKSRVIPEISYDPDESGFTNGRTRWIAARMYPITDQAGEVRHIVLTYEDITERKQAE